MHKAGQAKRWDAGAFPKESLQSVSLHEIQQSTLSTLQWTRLGCVRRKSPVVSMRITLNVDKAFRVKQQRAVSPPSIISSLSGLAKQGDSLFFNHHALLIRKELESPFC